MIFPVYLWMQTRPYGLLCVLGSNEADICTYKESGCCWVWLRLPVLVLSRARGDFPCVLMGAGYTLGSILCLRVKRSS